MTLTSVVLFILLVGMGLVVLASDPHPSMRLAFIGVIGLFLASVSERMYSVGTVVALITFSLATMDASIFVWRAKGDSIRRYWRSRKDNDC